MAFFRRNRKKDPGPASIPGVPAAAMATGDFEVVVRALVEQLSGEKPIELGDDSISVGGGRTYLGNLRAGWNARPEGEREIYLRNALHGLLSSELRNMDSLDTSMLRPGIRSEWLVHQIDLMQSLSSPGSLPDAAAAIAHRPMADGLVRLLIWDTPTTMSPINEGQLADWGADFDALWDIAVANLANDPMTGGWSVANKSVWRSLDGDDYAAERIFIDGYLDKLELGEHVVLFHPNRNTLMLTAIDDAAGLTIAAEMAAQAIGQPNPVALTPIVGNGLQWHPLVLPEGHPAKPKVDYLRIIDQTELYADQKRLLEQLHGDDLFVATFKAYQKDDTITTMAAWTEGVASLLPVASAVAFVSHGGSGPEVFDVPWEAAVSVVGNLMQPTGYFPQRVRVVDFPSREQLAELRGYSTHQ